MTVAGTYELTLHTPQGPMPLSLTFTQDGASLSGRATSEEGQIELVEPATSGNQVTWKLPITKPMPLSLSCEATVDGDAISGTAKVGSIATIPFEGKRV